MQQINYQFKNDHEVVIALIEDFNNSVEEFNRTMLSNSSDILEIKKILLEQNQKTESRLNKLEEDWKNLDAKRLANDVRESKESWENYHKTKHIAWIVASTGFFVIGYILNLALTYFKIGLK